MLSHNEFTLCLFGSPSMSGRSRTQMFNSIVERVVNRVEGWKEKLLSKAEKEILIKAVAQTIPTYSMSCFLLPLGILQKIQSYITNY